MNDKWLDLAIRIQSIAQAGLQYGKDPYDKERYTELRRIAAEMVSEKTDLPVDKIYDLFCNESGYQTPKVDTRAAVFFSSAKTTGRGLCPEGGATLTSPSPPSRKTRCGRRPDSL